MIRRQDVHEPIVNDTVKELNEQLLWLRPKAALSLRVSIFRPRHCPRLLAEPPVRANRTGKAVAPQFLGLKGHQLNCLTCAVEKLVRQYRESRMFEPLLIVTGRGRL